MTKQIPGPWLPYKESDVERRAIQAVWDGTATDGQQRAALEAIFQICGLDDLSYRPNSDRDTSFAEGKRFVGLQILKIAKLKATKQGN